MAKDIITYKDAGQSSARLRLAEAYLFSSITLLPDKYLLTGNTDRFRQGIKDDMFKQAYHKRAVIFSLAFPGGNSNSGSFNNASNYGCWWSATENNATNAWNRNLNYNNATVNRNNNNKTNGFSMRCVKN